MNNVNEGDLNIDINKISEMLEDALTIYKQDREAALENYKTMREQLDDIREAGLPMSEEGVLENAVNQALKLQMESAKRLDMVITTIAKIFNSQMGNKTKLIIADKIIGAGEKDKLTRPIDMKEIENRFK